MAQGVNIPAGPRKGILGVIIVCLVGSGLFRVASGNVAFAEARQSGNPDIAAQAPGDHGGADACTPADAPEAMLRAIRERRAALAVQESRMADRLQALNVAELRLKENTAALIEAENRLAATLSIADAAAEKDLKRLTSVYENMKPKNAASLFAEMAPEFAAGFLARMRAESAALILSSLAPEKAYTISLILAGRNALAPVR